MPELSFSSSCVVLRLQLLGMENEEGLIPEVVSHPGSGNTAGFGGSGPLGPPLLLGLWQRSGTLLANEGPKV